MKRIVYSLIGLKNPKSRPEEVVSNNHAPLACANPINKARRKSFFRHSTDVSSILNQNNKPQSETSEVDHGVDSWKETKVPTCLPSMSIENLRSLDSVTHERPINTPLRPRPKEKAPVSAPAPCKTYRQDTQYDASIAISTYLRDAYLPNHRSTYQIQQYYGQRMYVQGHQYLSTTKSIGSCRCGYTKSPIGENTAPCTLCGHRPEIYYWRYPTAYEEFLCRRYNHANTLFETSCQDQQLHNRCVRMNRYRVRFEGICDSSEQQSRESNSNKPVEEKEIFDFTKISDVRWKARLQGRSLEMIDGTRKLKSRTLAHAGDMSNSESDNSDDLESLPGYSEIHYQDQSDASPTVQINEHNPRKNTVQVYLDSHSDDSRSNRHSMTEFGQLPPFDRRCEVYLGKTDATSRAGNPSNNMSGMSQASQSFVNLESAHSQARIASSSIPRIEITSPDEVLVRHVPTTVLLGPNTDFWAASQNSGRREYSNLSRGNIKRRGVIGVILGDPPMKLKH